MPPDPAPWCTVLDYEVLSFEGNTNDLRITCLEYATYTDISKHFLAKFVIIPRQQR